MPPKVKVLLQSICRSINRPNRHLYTLQPPALVAGFFFACDAGNEPTIDYISVAPVTRQVNNVKYQVPNTDHPTSI